MNHLRPCYEFWADSEGMDRPSRPPELALAGLVVMSAALLFAALPPFTGMALAVVAAISWCIWLDRHPTS
jgi:hypothetical protein